MKYIRVVAPAAVAACVLIILLLLFGNPFQNPEELNARFEGIDPFLHTALFQLIENSLLQNPLGYYDLPFLFPDPVPIRGTEPLIPLFLHHLPMKILSGGNGPLSFKLQIFTTILLLALLTYALFRLLGVGIFISALGGISTVALHWWFLFNDRIQMITLYWLPLVLILFVIWLKSRKLIWLVLLTVSLALFSLTSLYVTLALCLIGFVLLPVIVVHIWRQRDRKLLPVAISGILAAALAFVLLIPWLSHRWDSGIYENEDYLDYKSWRSWGAELLIHQPLEMAHTPIGLPTDVESYGSFPGYAALCLLGAVLWFAFPLRKPDGDKQRFLLWLRRARAIAGWGWLAWALGGSFLLPAVETPLLFFGDILLWTWLGTWVVLLALRNFDWSNPGQRNPWLSSLCILIGLLFIMLTLGAPMRVISSASPVCYGPFSVAMKLITPLEQARELHRFIIPAGWFFVIALGFSHAARRFEQSGIMVVAPVSALFCILSVFEVWNTEIVTRPVPKILKEYALMDNSTGSGGLLELPYFKWVHPHEIRRMYWQQQHGRPIADGYTGIMPAWRAAAEKVYNSFPSPQSLALLRAWKIDTVLAEAAHEVDDEALPDGVHLKGNMNGWRVYDLDLDKLPQLEHYEIPDDLQEVSPTIYQDGHVDLERTELLTNGDVGFRSKVTLSKNQWMVFHVDEGPVAGIILDFGYGAFFLMPDEVVVEARVDGEWQRVDIPEGSRFIGARSADLLMHSRFARIYIPLREVDATAFRLQADEERWEFPELKLVVRNQNK